MSSSPIPRVTPQLEKMRIRAAMQAQVSAAYPWVTEVTERWYARFMQSVRRDSEILAAMLPEVRRAA